MSDAYEYGVANGPLKLKKPKDLFKKTEEPPLDSKEALTEAEKKYREALHQRKLERIDRLASKSYRDRVKEFNEKLERAPEHHDMPKVGPG
ncbi:hypothetical protein J3B02_001002 [Coemansia erecta]|nr:hypothetical protein J3B02_001002 [Coemansia erecta]